MGTICTADPVSIFRENITQGEKINEKKKNEKLRNYRVLGQVPGAAGSIGEKRRKADSDRISVYPLTRNTVLITVTLFFPKLKIVMGLFCF